MAEHSVEHAQEVEHARDRARVSLKAAAERVLHTVRRPLTQADEEQLAYEADRVRGYLHLSREERSKRAHELAEGAPQIHWTPRHAR